MQHLSRPLRTNAKNTLLPYLTPRFSLMVNSLLCIHWNFGNNVQVSQRRIQYSMNIINTTIAFAISALFHVDGFRWDPTISRPRHGMLGAQSTRWSLLQPGPPSVSGCHRIVTQRRCGDGGSSAPQNHDRYLILEHARIESRQPYPQSSCMPPRTK